jgi:hypothetical protein
MRYLTITATILVALAALSPHETTANPPPPPHSGSGWYINPHGYGYGGNYGYYHPVTPFFSGLPIRITNPATNGVTLSYMLNGVTYSIAPGYSQDLTLDRSWVVNFSRGGNFGEARYGLEPGLYSFAPTDHGWELFHGAIAQPGVVRTPSNTLPMNPTPSAAMPVTPAPAPMPVTPAPAPMPVTPAPAPAPM